MNDPYMQGGDDLSDPISLSGVSPMRYMANGGFVVPPQLPVVYRPEDREYLEARQAEAEAYDAQRTAYNAALEKYKTEVYNPYESQLNAYNAAAEAYNRDVYEPYQAAYKTYEEAVNAFNAGPMDTEYAGPAEPTLTPFSMTAPVAPAAFSMTAPTVPFKEEDVAARQAQAAEAARQDAESRQFAFEAINDPGQYNLAGMSQGSGIAGLSVPGYMKGGPVIAKPPAVLTSKQMLRKLSNKTKKFADGGAVTSPTLAERIAALQRTISSMPEVIATGPSRLGNRPMEPNPSLLAARQELDKLVAQQRSQAAAVPVITPAPTAVTTPTTPTTPTPTTAKTDLTELSKPVVVSTPPASGNAAGAAGSVIAATPSVFSGARPITALPVVPGSAPALQKPISTTAPAPSSAKSDLAEISKPGPSIPELIYISPEERPDYQPPGTKPPATQPPPLMGALPIKEFMPPGSPQIAPPVVQPPGGGAGTPMTSQELGKFVLEMAVKKTKPDLMWDANQDGRISAADALQVAKGWRPKDYGQQPISTPSPKTYPPEFVGPLPEGAKREPSTMPNVPGIPDFPPVITPPGGNVTILPRPGLPPGTSVGPMPPGQSLPPVSPTPPRTPVTPQPVVPVPQMPTMPRTPPLFRPPPPGSMPGTLPMPFNPFQINQGPTAQDLLQQNPNLSPTILGGQSNLGFMQDRLGNVIRAPGMPPPVRAFADGGIASRTAALNAYNLSDEEDEPILTDPVGTASQMLRELNPQTQMEYEATPKKVSMKRISKTPMGNASGTAKGMKMELDEISAMKMPKELKATSKLSRLELEELAREYGLKRAAALDTAKGLMRATFEKPTLEKPSLTKGSLSVKRFEKGGLVEKIGQWLVENDIHPTDFLAALGRIGSAASLALTPRALNEGESEALARLRKMTATTDSPASATDLPAAFAGGGEVKKSDGAEEESSAPDTSFFGSSRLLPGVPERENVRQDTLGMIRRMDDASVMAMANKLSGLPFESPVQARVMLEKMLGPSAVSLGVMGSGKVLPERLTGYSLGARTPLAGGEFRAGVDVPRGVGKPMFNVGYAKEFQEGGEVMSPEEQPVVEESKASQALKELIRPVREGVKGYFGMDPESSGSEAYRTGQAVSNMPGVGAPATLGIFIGKSSKLWNKAMNEAARKMEKSGAPPEEIWQKTGNFKGPDNQWRQEISDLGATQRTQVSQGPASMVFQHPELYQNYPDMKDLFIRTDPYAVRSSYTGSGVPGAEEISLGTAGGKLENIRGLLHEMQHGIQFREGFGLGGSKITAFNDPKAFEILEMVRKRVSTPATLEEFAKGAYQTTKITPKIEDEYKNLYLKNYAANLKSGGLDRMAQEEAARIYYNRLLGETEARAVEDRRLFTPEQRLEVFPTKSYKVDGKPVAVEDLIIKRPMKRAKGGPVNKHDAFIKAHA